MTSAGIGGSGAGPGGGTPSATVSEGEWLAVSTEGFSEQQRGRPLGHLVKELVQNALDAVDGRGRIELTLTPTGPRTAVVRCSDDGPGAESLSRLNVVFVTGKKDGVAQRGRMGRGFKELLSIATGATVRSRGEELAFDVGEDGVRRVTHRRGLPPRAGFEAVMEVEHDQAAEDLSGYFRGFLLPDGVAMAVNGTEVPRRPVHRVVEARLTTERFAGGRWEKPRLASSVHLVAAADGEAPTIYEMGIPVCGVEWTEPYHCDVQQRVPMNPNRDAVMSGYPARLHRACLAALLEGMTPERAKEAWVGEAAQSAPDAVQKAVVDLAFGGSAVRAVPVAGRFDHNAEAEELGRTVLHTAHMPGGFRRLLQQQVPSAADVSRESRREQERAAAEAALTRDEVAALDPGEAGGPGSGGPGNGEPGDGGLRRVEREVARHGRDVVLARMDFARWFAEAVALQRHGRPRAVPVKVALIEGGTATWSETGVLTLGLDAAQWGGPITAHDLEVLLHEMAHREAFHHGRGFPREVEAYAGAAAMVMLTRGGEARDRFPKLMPGEAAG